MERSVKFAIIIFMALAACVGNAGGAGEYTANRMPGTNLMWTAGRTAAEIAAAAETNAAALASATNALTAALAGEAALRVSGTNDLYAAITNEAALRVSGTNALHVEISGATAAASAATNQSASALAIAQSATNTASTALALGVTATNTAATANALAATATNDSATALALSVTATNAAAEANATAGIAYLYATNAAAQAAGVYTPATNAAAVAALAWSRANLAYTLAGSVYGYATNAIDIATNAAAQVATAYPAATNALVQATNATAVSAAAYVLASNAWDTATNAYVTATNAQHRVGLAETNKADKTELANYETVQDAQIVAAVAVDASQQAEMAVKTNDVRWLAALTNETDAAALAALAGYKPSALWEGTNFHMVIEGNTNLVFYSIVTAQTNYSITYSAGFRKEEDGVISYPPFTNSIPFPIETGYDQWTLYDNGQYRQMWASLSTLWQADDLSWPSVLLPLSSFSYGTATVARVIVYPTQEVYRVDIPALTNLAARLAGLAGTDTVTLVSSALGTHTNDAGIHVTSGDKELIDSVPGITQEVAAVSGAFAGFTNSIPAAGCSVLSMTDETNLVVTGATYAYTAQVTTNYWLSIAPTAPAYHYSLTVYGTNACTLADNMRLIGTKTETGTNCVAFKPWTNGLWEVMWGGK